MDRFEYKECVSDDDRFAGTVVSFGNIGDRLFAFDRNRNPFGTVLFLLYLQKAALKRCIPCNPVFAVNHVGNRDGNHLSVLL